MRAVVGVVLALLGVTGFHRAPPAAARGPGAGAPPSPWVVVADPDATVAAAALVVPGSAWEMPWTRGLTVLTAKSLLEELRPALDSLGAVADVECGAALFVFRVVAPAGAGERALELLLDGVLRPRIGGAAVERARGTLAASLALEAASPSWLARLAARQALYGDAADDDAWSAPPCGAPEAPISFDTAWVRAGAYRFQPDRAAVAVTGAIDSVRAAGILLGRLPRSPRPPFPAPSAVRPGRRYVERDAVSAWLTVAWPFDAGTDPDALRLLGALLEAEVAPTSDRPDVLAARVELTRHGAGGALLVHVVLEPGSAAAYARGLEARVAALAAAEPPGRGLERVVLRERGRRLLERATPESRAAAMAVDLALGGPPGDGWPRFEGLTPAAVRAAAAALGPPARSVVGPGAARAAVVESGAAP